MNNLFDCVTSYKYYTFIDKKIKFLEKKKLLYCSREQTEHSDKTPDQYPRHDRAKMHKARLSDLSFYFLTLHSGSENKHIEVQFQQKYPFKNYLSPKK